MTTLQQAKRALRSGDAAKASVALVKLSRSPRHQTLLPGVATYENIADAHRAEVAMRIRQANMAAARNVTLNWITY